MFQRRKKKDGICRPSALSVINLVIFVSLMTCFSLLHVHWSLMNLENVNNSFKERHEKPHGVINDNLAGGKAHDSIADASPRIVSGEITNTNGLSLASDIPPKDQNEHPKPFQQQAQSAKGHPSLAQDASPKIIFPVLGLNAKGAVHYLPSIPQKRRPKEVNEIKAVRRDRDEPKEEDRKLYVYNPDLLPLRDLSHELLQQLLPRKVIEGATESSIIETIATKYTYLALYRVSNFSGCLGARMQNGRKNPPTHGLQNYLGIAFVDKNLDIVPDSDVIINMNLQVTEEMREAALMDNYQDCHLSATTAEHSPNAKKDQLYLTCNIFWMPVKIIHRDNAVEYVKQKSTYRTKEDKNRFPYMLFENLYGDGFQLTFLTRQHAIQDDKNTHLFETFNATTGEKRTFLEIWPTNPHVVQEIQLPQDITGRTGTTFLPVINKEAGRNLTNNEDTSGFPLLSATKDVIRSMESGSACCVNIQHEGKDLLLGLSHVRSKRGMKHTPKYQYLSRVYAFDPNSDVPFEMEFKSDLFCLSYPLEDEKMRSDNPALGVVDPPILKYLDQTTPLCPAIHFVTGIVEKDGDESKVIVSYGINGM